MSAPHAFYECRDIGYGIEAGEIDLPALDGPDWAGKRPYSLIWSTCEPEAPSGTTVWLFDDEVVS